MATNGHVAFFDDDGSFQTSFSFSLRPRLCPISASGESVSFDSAQPTLTAQLLQNGRLRLIKTIVVTDAQEQRRIPEAQLRLELARRRYDRDAIQRRLLVEETKLCDSDDEHDADERASLECVVAQHEQALNARPHVVTVQVTGTTTKHTIDLEPNTITCVSWLKPATLVVWIPDDPNNDIQTNVTTESKETEIALVPCEHPKDPATVFAAGMQLCLGRRWPSPRLVPRPRAGIEIRAPVSNTSWEIPESHGRDLEDYHWTMVPVEDRVVVGDRITGQVHMLDPLLPAPQQWRRLEDLPASAGPTVRFTSDLGRFVFAVSRDSVFRLDVPRNQWETIFKDLKPPVLRNGEAALWFAHVRYDSGAIFGKFAKRVWKLAFDRPEWQPVKRRDVPLFLYESCICADDQFECDSEDLPDLVDIERLILIDKGHKFHFSEGKLPDSEDLPPLLEENDGHAWEEVD